MAESKSKSMSSVCDLLGKKCKGNIEYYTVPGKTNMKVGLRIHPTYGDVGTVSEGKYPSISQLLGSPEYLDMLDKVKHDVIGNNLILSTEEDVSISEISANGITYPVFRLPYGRHFLYYIKLVDDTIKDNVNSIIAAFVVFLMTEAEMKEGQ